MEQKSFKDILQEISTNSNEMEVLYRHLNDLNRSCLKDSIFSKQEIAKIDSICDYDSDGKTIGEFLREMNGETTKFIKDHLLTEHEIGFLQERITITQYDKADGKEAIYATICFKLMSMITFTNCVNRNNRMALIELMEANSQETEETN